MEGGTKVVDVERLLENYRSAERFDLGQVDVLTEAGDEDHRNRETGDAKCAKDVDACPSWHPHVAHDSVGSESGVNHARYRGVPVPDAIDEDPVRLQLTREELTKLCMVLCEQDGEGPRNRRRAMMKSVAHVHDWSTWRATGARWRWNLVMLMKPLLRAPVLSHPSGAGTAAPGGTMCREVRQPNELPDFATGPSG